MLGRLAAMAAGLSIMTNAHMFISSPPPIEGSAPKSPLDASGSNFPCHGVALPASGGTSMAAGAPQILAFDTGNGANWAVHGGGSCQISITYETDPTKVKDPKNWYVIYSIEGGCPSNTHQNLDGSYLGPGGVSYTGALPCTDPRTNGVDCVNSFNFTVPKGVKDGHAILAWTWFNSVGNREMYMNCVNAQLSGGDGSEMDKFPSMFVANMADVNQCPTTASIDLRFPYPGSYVTTKTPSGIAASTAIRFPMQTPAGPGCESDGAPVGGGAGLPPAVGSVSSSISAISTQGAGAVNAIVTVTTLATVTGSPSLPPQAPPSTSSPSTSMAGGTGSSTGSSNCAEGSVPCSSTGSIICIGSSQWGECDIDHCAIPMDLAAGTSCSNGSIVKRSTRHTYRHGARHA